MPRPGSCGLLVARIGLYVAPGRAAGEGPLQTPKGQVEEKKKGEARREEEPSRTGTVRAGSWERWLLRDLSPLPFGTFS